MYCWQVLALPCHIWLAAVSAMIVQGPTMSQRACAVPLVPHLPYAAIMHHHSLEMTILYLQKNCVRVLSWLQPNAHAYVLEYRLMLRLRQVCAHRHSV
jgi:hypothetical protein